MIHHLRAWNFSISNINKSKKRKTERKKSNTYDWFRWSGSHIHSHKRQIIKKNLIFKRKVCINRYLVLTCHRDISYFVASPG